MIKILVIEDEPTLREEVMEWLVLEGYDVIGAEDGIVGVEQAFSHLPDLIICDISMPRLDGYGVLYELRSNPLTSTIPFIFVTAKASYEDIRKGMSIGADDYIIKPYSLMDVVQAIKTRLDKKATQEQHHKQDIEQLKDALTQEHERLMLKAKIVAMYSHDFRNPLTTILSSNNLMRDYADRMDDARRLTHMNRIEVSVRQLLQMLDDMLFIAQMETGHLDFKQEKLNPEPFFKAIVDEFQIIHNKTHQVIFENRVRDIIWCDPRLLRQIASNLISNAIKYSPQGGKVWVILENYEDRYTLMVQDEGIGISEEDQQRLFQAFQRGSNVGHVTGTGLGLAIIKQAVDLQGGSVHLESQLGKGTTVTIAIPVHRAVEV